MTITLNACRGNFKSAWIAEGGYEPVAEAMFSADVDAFFMEFDSARAGGLVSSTTGALESKDALKRRIDEAAKHVPLEQWGKLELVVEMAEDVWG